MVRFGVFEFDSATGELWRAGRVVRLAPQPARLLAALTARPGELVSRDELRAALWSDGTYADFDAGIATCVNQIRAALGDEAANPRFVETLPRRGYRFIAPLRSAAEGGAVTPADPPNRRRGSLVVAAVATGLLLAIVAAWTAVKGPPGMPRVAVLPIETAADQPGLAAPAALFTETLTGDLSRASRERVEVLSRLAANHLRGERRTLEELGALPADFLVDASLRRLGGAVRLHAKLVARSDFRIHWLRDIDLPAADLEVRSIEVSRQLASALLAELERQARARDEPATGEVGRDDLLSARLCLREGDPARAVEHYESARLALPGRSSVESELALALLVAARSGRLEAEGSFRRASTAAEQALAADPGDPEALTALAGIAWWRERSTNRAETLLRTAIENGPTGPLAHAWLAVLLAEDGRREEALREAASARALDAFWRYPAWELEQAGLGAEVDPEAPHSRGVASLEAP